MVGKVFVIALLLFASHRFTVKFLTCLKKLLKTKPTRLRHCYVLRSLMILCCLRQLHKLNAHECDIEISEDRAVARLSTSVAHSDFVHGTCEEELHVSYESIDKHRLRDHMDCVQVKQQRKESRNRGLG